MNKEINNKQKPKEKTKHMTLYRRALYLEFFSTTDSKHAYLKLNHNHTRTNQANISVKVSKYIDTSASATIIIAKAPDSLLKHIMACEKIKVHAGWIDDSNPFKPDILTKCIHEGEIRLTEQKSNQDISILSFHKSQFMNVEIDKKTTDTVKTLSANLKAEKEQLDRQYKKYIKKYNPQEKDINEFYTKYAISNKKETALTMSDDKKSLISLAELILDKQKKIDDLKKDVLQDQKDKLSVRDPDFPPFVVYGINDPRRTSETEITYKQLFEKTNIEYQKEKNFEKEKIHLSNPVKPDSTKVFAKYDDVIQFINNGIGKFHPFSIYYNFTLKKYVIFDLTEKNLLILSWDMGLIKEPIINNKTLQFTTALQPFLKPNRLVKINPEAMSLIKNTKATALSSASELYDTETQANKDLIFQKEIANIYNPNATEEQYDEVVEKKYIITKVEHNFSNYIAESFVTNVTAGVYYDQTAKD